MTDHKDLIERLEADMSRDEFYKAADKMCREAAAALREQQAEIERCHARLEIDREWRADSGLIAGGVLVEIPHEERASQIDGIECRDATISGLEEQLAGSQAEIERLRTPHLRSLIAHGYAPGSYMCFCGECGERHTADKRAWRCLKCAEARAALGKDGA